MELSSMLVLVSSILFSTMSIIVVLIVAFWRSNAAQNKLSDERFNEQSKLFDEQTKSFDERLSALEKMMASMHETVSRMQKDMVKIQEGQEELKESVANIDLRLSHMEGAVEVLTKFWISFFQQDQPPLQSARS